MQINGINCNRDKFPEAIQHSLEPEPRKVWLVPINVRIAFVDQLL